MNYVDLEGVVVARRSRDPLLLGESAGHIERHYFIADARAVGRCDFPLDPNPRDPNVDRRLYREVEKSLLNEDTVAGTFHLKNKGLTVVASEVTKLDENRYRIGFREGEGLLDGGHTHEIVKKHRDDAPDGQYVKIEVLTAVPQSYVPLMAGGLNSAMQVKEAALVNLEKRFEWLKEALGDWADKVAWRQNEDGEIDALDVLARLHAMNIFEHPNNGTTHPVMAYEKKLGVLKHFQGHEQQFHRLAPLARDVLRLYDTLGYEARELWNASGGKFGKLDFVEQKKTDDVEYHFLGKTAKHKLQSGAVFPMLGALRWGVVEIDGKAAWNGGFDGVVALWQETAVDMLRKTLDANRDLGYNPHALGRNRNHWGGLHSAVGLKVLLAREA